jgi:quinone-modifying oxidoreductase, subunit QmoA
MTPSETNNGGRKDVLVIGGGIAGMTSAIEAAEAGCQVLLVEKAPYLGGRVAGMNQYFPKLCPPTCGLEINLRRLRQNHRIEWMTMATVASVGGGPGAYDVTVSAQPRHVSDACTACGDCVKACPAERADEFSYGMGRTKAIYLPHIAAFPAQYVVDRTVCPPECQACVLACTPKAVDLDERPQTRTYQVGTIIAATGWAPYDAKRIDNLGFGRFANVITNLMMERLASDSGPTGGKILRPSDGAAPKSVAFVQCAGSRDENHLPYCSAVCCAASLKQATYVRSADAEAAVRIFYIDIRTPGRLEDFHQKVASDAGVELVKGKVAFVDEDPATHDLIVEVEDVENGRKIRQTVNMLVLATGLVPQAEGVPGGFSLDEFGFMVNVASRPTLRAAGCVRRPGEVAAAVQDATGAALKALQSATRSARHG